MRSLIFSNIVLFNILLLILLLSIHSVRADKRIYVNVDLGSASSPADLPVEDVSDPDISSIKLLDMTSSVGFGDRVSFSFSAYRGKTLKRTIYSYIIDSTAKKLSDTVKFSLPERWTSYNFSGTLALKTTCTSASAFFLVLSGIDVEERSEIVISCPADPDSDEERSGTPAAPGTSSISSTGTLSFRILDYPEDVFSGVPFKVRVLVENPTEDFMDIQAWSYVYRSSKCVSGEREQNMKTINVPDFSNVTFDLENTVTAPPGDYSLKLKVLLPGVKTPKELTEDIRVLASSDREDDDDKSVSVLKISSENDTSDADKPKKIIQSRRLTPQDSTNSSLVYLSSSAKARRLVPLFMIVALSLLLIGLIIRNL
ncbi:TPA: hypothetical protein HA265_05880 [Candidatus Woesearchaeota archaeon]|nr:hypothetical protein [Candidatus Woesearchaeota archaeon]